MILIGTLSFIKVNLSINPSLTVVSGHVGLVNFFTFSRHDESDKISTFLILSVKIDMIFNLLIRLVRRLCQIYEPCPI